MTSNLPANDVPAPTAFCAYRDFGISGITDTATGKNLHTCSSDYASPGVSRQPHALNLNGPNWVTDGNTVATRMAQTGVKWAFLPVIWWNFEWAAPTGSPETGTESYRGDAVCPAPQECYHNYKLSQFANLDQLIEKLNEEGLTIAIGMYGPPEWASGSDQHVHEEGGRGGKIFNNYKGIFQTNLADLARNLAARYPFVKHWALWNEPNGQGYFSPQPTSFTAQERVEEAYRDLILLNSHPAIKEVTPDALIVGPELDTPREDVPLTTTDNLWGQSIVTYWLTDWSTYLLTNYHAYINKYSIHNYSDDAAVAWLRVQQLRQEMQIIAIEAVKPIWTTEVNMYAPNSRSVNAIANYVCQIYHAENLDWERSFHFPVVGDESKAYYESDGLLRAHTAPIPYEIKALYTYFQGIVNGSYYCNRN